MIKALFIVVLLVAWALADLLLDDRPRRASRFPHHP